MLDKIRQMLGLDTNQQTEAEVNEPLTQDELLKQYMEQYKQLSEKEREAYRKQVEEAISGFSQIVDSGQTAVKSETKHADTSSIKDEREPTLSEDPTVEEVIGYIERKVTQAVLKAIETKLQTLPVVPPSIPAEMIVDSIVKQHPALETVADEAKQMLSKLPMQLQNKETADFILWWLKGKRSEAEKKDIVAEMVGAINKPASQAAVTLPYTSAEIERYAEAMGIDAKTLKQRLYEQMSKEVS
ncbi:MAG: hypothetical protein QXW98_06115 [Candidatus Caldarchaeum sp.]